VDPMDIAIAAAVESTDFTSKKLRLLFDKRAGNIFNL
jgi:hypothetical protein